MKFPHPQSGSRCSRHFPQLGFQSLKKNVLLDFKNSGRCSAPVGVRVVQRLQLMGYVADQVLQILSANSFCGCWMGSRYKQFSFSKANGDHPCTPPKWLAITCGESYPVPDRLEHDSIHKHGTWKWTRIQIIIFRFVQLREWSYDNPRVDCFDSWFFFIAHRSFSSTPSHPPDKDWAPVISSDLDDHTKPVHVQQEDGKLGREWKNWKDLAKRASPKKNLKLTAPQGMNDFSSQSNLWRGAPVFLWGYQNCKVFGKWGDHRPRTHWKFSMSYFWSSWKGSIGKSNPSPLSFSKLKGNQLTCDKSH